MLTDDELEEASNEPCAVDLNDIMAMARELLVLRKMIEAARDAIADGPLLMCPDDNPLHAAVRDYDELKRENVPAEQVREQDDLPAPAPGQMMRDFQRFNAESLDSQVRALARPSFGEALLSELEIESRRSHCREARDVIGQIWSAVKRARKASGEGGCC